MEPELKDVPHFAQKRAELLFSLPHRPHFIADPPRLIFTGAPDAHRQIAPRGRYSFMQEKYSNIYIPIGPGEASCNWRRRGSKRRIERGPGNVFT
jgi:hypothetical protein